MSYQYSGVSMANVLAVVSEAFFLQLSYCFIWLDAIYEALRILLTISLFFSAHCFRKMMVVAIWLLNSLVDTTSVNPVNASNTVLSPGVQVAHPSTFLLMVFPVSFPFFTSFNGMVHPSFCDLMSSFADSM